MTRLLDEKGKGLEQLLEIGPSEKKNVILAKKAD